MSHPAPAPIVRHLGRKLYSEVWQAMRSFTDQRTAQTPDEIWVVEHEPVYTLGLNGRKEHVLNAEHIPVVECDRGGQVTYHGPGQIVVYFLLDLRRRNLGVKPLVHLLEQAVIDLLQQYDIPAVRKDKAPGVYVHGEKIAALGLRVRKGCSYHGLSLNVNMDLEPFDRINPCGYVGLKTTQLKDLGCKVGINQVTEDLLQQLHRLLKKG
ncbi:lipoyl(octanoyl) transferase LipB [Kaarinaea lacus]